MKAPDVYDNDWLTAVPDCTPDMKQRARITVCDKAESVDDAKLLLDMLGLLE